MSGAERGDADETRQELPSPRASTRTPDLDVGNRFEVGRELGRGGMGRVVAATDRSLEREVAIKQALRDDESHLARFDREVRITARLEHPSIIPVHDAGRDRMGRPYYVMRRLEGDHLSDRIKAATTPRARLALVPHVLAAVEAAAFAHARRIIHRDIKPGNILVGAYGETLLIDWGLARELDEAELPASPGPASEPSLTHAGGVFGTPGYMSPEQRRGELADERADVYALGATLLHVLTGDTSWLHEIARGAEVGATRFALEVPPELIAIVTKAMASDRADRYRHAGELATDLRAFLAGQLVAAHHYTWREHVARFVRRHRVAVAISVAASVLVAVVATISIRNVIEERDRARVAREVAEGERALAIDRAEVMLLDRASALTSGDPTRAVAMLRQLPPTSTHLRRAREIAETAAMRGISHGLETGLESITYLAFTSDGKQLLAIGDRGAAWAIDVATGTHRAYDLHATSGTALLLDDEHLLYGDTAGLSVLALSSGTATNLVPGVKLKGLWPAHGGFRYLDSATGELVEHSLQNTNPRILATGVKAALACGESLVVGDGNALRIVGSDRPLELATSPGAGSIFAGASSPDGRRFAIASNDGVIEWESSGRELRRWTLDMVGSLTYASPATPDRPPLLLASTKDGRTLLLREGGQVRDFFRSEGAMMWQAVLPRGAAFLDTSGHLEVLHGGYRWPFPLDLPRSRTLAASADGRYLAIGSSAGTVRWLDTRLMLPELHRVPRNAHACWADAREILLLDAGQLRSISRTTGEVRERGRYPQELYIGCEGRLGDVLVLRAPVGTVLLDLVRGSHEVVPATGQVDVEVGRFVFARARELVDHDPASRRDTVAWTAPAEIMWSRSRGRWAVVATRGGLLSRIDRVTGDVTSVSVPEVMAATIEADGAVVFARAGAMWRWDGAMVTKLFELPVGSVHWVEELATGYGFQLEDRSLWYAGASGVIQRVPANSLQFQGLDAQDLAWRRDGAKRVWRHDLVSGEQVSFEAQLTMIVHTHEGLTLGTGDDLVVIFERQTPRELAELFGWIDRSTNAYVDRNAALRWSTR